MVCFVFDIEIVFVVFLKIVCLFCECFLSKKINLVFYYYYYLGYCGIME